jgi:hypothetical protein
MEGGFHGYPPLPSRHRRGHRRALMHSMTFNQTPGIEPACLLLLANSWTHRVANTGQWMYRLRWTPDRRWRQLIESQLQKHDVAFEPL